MVGVIGGVQELLARLTQQLRLVGIAVPEDRARAPDSFVWRWTRGADLLIARLGKCPRKQPCLGSSW